MKQNVGGEEELAEGYHWVALIASGWAKHFGGPSDCPSTGLPSASVSRSTRGALRVKYTYRPIFCRCQYRATIMTPGAQ